MVAIASPAHGWLLQYSKTTTTGKAILIINVDKARHMPWL
jgi:hypothetical protein